MSHRFFLNYPPSAELVVLEGDQAHHAIHVMRFTSGHEVVLFDGSGKEYRAVIEEVAKKRLSLKILDSTMLSRSVSTQLTMAVALPKGDRQKFMVEKLVELGVHRLVPLKTNRSVAVANEKVVQRLRKQVIEASKQCGRNLLMEIGEEQSLNQFSESVDSFDVKLIADPYQGRPISQLNNDGSVTETREIAVAVGPEGGFDESEKNLTRELGFEPIRLGPTILRVETAALAIAAILGIGIQDRNES